VADHVGDVECQQRSDVAQCACMIAAAAYDFRDVSVHSQDRVKCDTEQLDGVAKRDHRPCDVNAARRRIYV